jgi:hypothetical protein
MFLASEDWFYYTVVWPTGRLLARAVSKGNVLRAKAHFQEDVRNGESSTFFSCAKGMQGLPVNLNRSKTD